MSNQDVTRAAAVDVAKATFDLFASTRWRYSPCAEQAYGLATYVLTSDAQVGAVWQAGYGERCIPVIAEAAFRITELVHEDAELGNISLPIAGDSPLIDLTCAQILS